MKLLGHTGRGFTLIELLVSMAVGSIVLLVAALFLRGGGDAYNQVGGSVAAEREARSLITQLRADLSTASFHKDGVIEASGADWPRDRIGFLSLQPDVAQTDDGRIGDLCAVHYYVKDLDVAGELVRCLMRGFSESKDVFSALSADSVNGLFAERPQIDEPIAFGVLAFQVKPRKRDENGGWVDWVKNDSTGPEALDLRVVIARRELAAKLETTADWDGAGAAANLFGAAGEADGNHNMEVYEASIRFGNDAQ